MYRVCFFYVVMEKKAYVKKHDNSLNKLFAYIGVLQPSEKSPKRGGKDATFIFLKYYYLDLFSYHKWSS